MAKTTWQDFKTQTNVTDNPDAGLSRLFITANSIIIRDSAGAEKTYLALSADETTLTNTAGELSVVDVPESVSNAIVALAQDMGISDANDTSINTASANDLLKFNGSNWVNTPTIQILNELLTKGIIEAKLTGEITTHSHDTQLAEEHGIIDDASDIDPDDNGAVVKAYYSEDDETKPSELKLLLHFTGGEGETTIEDKSDSAHSPVITGNAYITKTTGESGSCLHTSGGAIQIPFSTDFNNPDGPFAIDGYFKPLDSTTRAIPIFNIPSCLKVWLNYGPSPKLWVSWLLNGEGTWATNSYSVSVSTSTFSHVMLQNDGTNMHIGWNGSLLASVEIEALTAYTTGACYIGYHDDSGDVYAYGYFDEFRYHTSEAITVDETGMTYTIPVSSYLTQQYKRSDIHVDIVTLEFGQINLEDHLLIVYHAQGIKPINPQLLDPSGIECETGVQHYNNYLTVDMSEYESLTGTWKIRFRGNESVCYLGGPTSTNIKYVDASATGDNNGTSWEDAFTDLQVALDNVSNGDQIWVAAGTYLPAEQLEASAPYDPLNKAFVPKCNVSIYGGFAGTETLLTERDYDTNLTYLSNLVSAGSYGYSLLYCDSYTVVLDGFFGIDFGGFIDVVSGIYACNSANLTVRNCSITSAASLTTDLVKSWGSSTSISLEDVELIGRASYQCRCYFSGPVSISNVELNTVQYHHFGRTLEANNLWIHSNSYNSSAFVHSNPDGNCSVTNMTMSYNNCNTSTLCVVTFDDEYQYDFINCTFAHNTADYMCYANSSHAYKFRITNCSFYTNTRGVAELGGSISSAIIIYNSFFEASYSPFIGYNCLVVPSGLGTFGDNGGFVPTISLQAASSCVDAGTFTNAPATDARGVARPQGLKIDIGAYEYEP